MKKFVFSALVLLAAQASYAGSSNHLIIQNNTDYPITKAYETSHRMNGWNFPESIAPHSQEKTYIEFNRNIFNPDPTQDTGDTGFNIKCPNGNSDNFEIQARQYNTYFDGVYSQKIYLMQHQFNCIKLDPPYSTLNWSSDPMVIKVNPA